MMPTMSIFIIILYFFQTRKYIKKSLLYYMFYLKTIIKLIIIKGRNF